MTAASEYAGAVESRPIASADPKPIASFFRPLSGTCAAGAGSMRRDRNRSRRAVPRKTGLSPDRSAPAGAGGAGSARGAPGGRVLLVGEPQVEAVLRVEE